MISFYIGKSSFVERKTRIVTSFFLYKRILGWSFDFLKVFSIWSKSSLKFVKLNGTFVMPNGKTASSAKRVNCSETMVSWEIKSLLSKSVILLEFLPSFVWY